MTDRDFFAELSAIVPSLSTEQRRLVLRFAAALADGSRQTAAPPIHELEFGRRARDA